MATVQIVSGTAPTGQYIKYADSTTAFNAFDVGDTILVSGSIGGNNGVYTILGIYQDGTHSFLSVTGKTLTSEAVEFTDDTCDTNDTPGSGTSFAGNPRIIQMDSTANVTVGAVVSGTGITGTANVTQIDSSTLFRIDEDVASDETDTTLTFQPKIGISTIASRGDKKVVLGDNDITADIGGGKIDIWSYNSGSWKSDAIIPSPYNENYTQSKFIFNFVDEVVRVCDIDRDMFSQIRWYGYIQRTQFSSAGGANVGLSFNNWYDCPAFLSRPKIIIVNDGTSLPVVSGTTNELNVATGGGNFPATDGLRARVITSNRKVTCSGAPSGGCGSFDDFTPTPSSAWEASQSHTFVSQTSTDGSGSGFVIGSIITDGSGNPTFKGISNPGINYIIDEELTFTDPGSTSNTAVLKVASHHDNNIDILFDNETDSAGNYTTGGFFHSGMVYSWVDVPSTKYEFLLCRTSPPTSETTKKIKFYRGFGQGSQEYGQIADNDNLWSERGRGWSVAINDAVANNSNWEADTYDIYGTFIYDGNQETQPLKSISDAVTSEAFDRADGTVTIASSGSSLTLKVGADIAYNPRVTGGRLYIKKSDSDEPLSLLADIDIEKGVRTSLESNYIDWAKTGSDSTANYQVVSGLELLSPNLDTYETINVFSANLDSYSIGQLNESYQCSVITNRRQWIGNINIYDSSKNIQHFGDRLMYSEINKFDSFPSNNFIDVSKGDYGNYVSLNSYADRIIAFKDSVVQIINVASPSPSGWFLESSHPNIGVKYSYSVTTTDFGVVWANMSGCYVYDGKGISNLIENKLAVNEDMTSSYSPWSEFIRGSARYQDPMVGYDVRSKHIIVLRSPSDKTTNSNQCYIYDIERRCWTYNDNLFTDSANYSSFITDWNNNLVFSTGGDTQSFHAYDSSATAQDYQIWVSREYDFGNPGKLKKLYAVYMTFKNVGSAVDAFAYYSIDGGENWSTLLVSIDGTVGDGSGNNDLLPTSSSWNIAKLYPISVVSFENIMFKLTTASTSTKLEINDFSIEYRVLHKRTG